jgi:PhnB protein
MATRPVPTRYCTLTPNLHVRRAADLVEFLKAAFGASEVERYCGDGGLVLHSEVKIGDSLIMIGEAFDAPRSGSVYLYVEDVDAVYAQALAAGATAVAEPEEQFYGARVGRVQDPFGNHWAIATQVEDLDPTQIRRRFEDLMSQQGGLS